MKKSYGNLIFNLVYIYVKKKHIMKQIVKLNKVRRCITDKLIKISIINNLEIIFQ